MSETTSGSDSAVDRLLRERISNLQSPSSEEVYRLVYELEVERSGLQRQNEELRKTQKQLEAYRDRYIDLYDSAPLGYATLDQDGYVQEINLAGAKLLGAERDSLTGYPLADYVAPDDRNAFLDHLRQCVSQCVQVTSEFRLQAKDGRSVVVHARSIPVEGPHNDTLCKTAITDITQRREMEEALQHERNLLRTLIDLVPDYIYVKDLHGRFIAANSATAHIMGVATPDDVLGKTDFDFYPRPLAAEYRADEEELLRTGRPLVNKDEPHLDPAGNPRTVLTTKVPLKDDQGRVVGLVGISRDITERKRAEEAVRLAHEEVAEHHRHEREEVERELAKVEDQLVRHTQLAAIGQISASIVHDLRNSLSAMKGTTGLLMDCLVKDEPKGVECVQCIEREVDTIGRIINNLMEMARAKEPRKETMDLDGVVRDVFGRLQHGGSVSCRIQCDPQPFTVAADPVQLRQVFENLLVNAIQVMEEGDIRVTARREGEVDVIVVEDDGPGVPDDLRDQVFEPLVTTRPKGTGLGLTICRQIIHRHGGTIELARKDGPGAAFLIRLPAACDSEPARP